MSSLEQQYKERYELFLTPAAEELERYIRDVFRGQARIDRITARAKSIGRFMQKALKEKTGIPHYTSPLTQIQDQIGCRIVTFYLSDVRSASEHALKHLRPIESKEIIP